MLLAMTILTTLAVMTGLLAAPSCGRTSVASAEHRRRYLGRHPQRTTIADVELLLGETVPPATVRPLVNRARRAGLAPSALWRWSETNGPFALALALCAGFGPDDFARHSPCFDTDSLLMLVELNGGSLGSLLLAGSA